MLFQVENEFNDVSEFYLINWRGLSNKRRIPKIKWNKGGLYVASQNNKQIWGSSFRWPRHRSNKSNNSGERRPAEKIKWTFMFSQSRNRKDIGWVSNFLVEFNGWESDIVLSFSMLREILLSEFLTPLLLDEKARSFAAARNLIRQWIHWHPAFYTWNYLVPNFCKSDLMRSWIPPMEANSGFATLWMNWFFITSPQVVRTIQNKVYS